MFLLRNKNNTGIAKELYSFVIFQGGSAHANNEITCTTGLTGIVYSNSVGSGIIPIYAVVIFCQLLLWSLRTVAF